LKQRRAARGDDVSEKQAVEEKILTVAHNAWNPRSPMEWDEAGIRASLKARRALVAATGEAIRQGFRLDFLVDRLREQRFSDSLLQVLEYLWLSASAGSSSASGGLLLQRLCS
jgi:hypothetical protein